MSMPRSDEVEAKTHGRTSELAARDRNNPSAYWQEDSKLLILLKEASGVKSLPESRHLRGSTGGNQTSV